MKNELYEEDCPSPLTYASNALYLFKIRVTAGKSLWEKAIDECDISLAKSIISYGRDINEQFSPVDRTLLSNGVSLHKFTPISYALYRFKEQSYKDEYLQMITLLLDAKANPNIPNTYDGKPYSTPLADFVSKRTIFYDEDYYWTEKQWLDIIELLIDRGANPNAEYKPIQYPHHKSFHQTRTILTDKNTIENIRQICEGSHERLLKLLTIKKQTRTLSLL